MTHIHPTRPRALRLILAFLLLAATPAAAQVSGGKVTLDDREPHTWSYYSDASLPEQLRSLNPADVTITYHGLGSNTVTAASSTEAVDQPTSFSRNATGVKVNYDADDSVFIYHKTLERTSGSEFGSAAYAYTTIPNPFQVRPTGNTGSVTVTPTTRTIYVVGRTRGTNNGYGISITYTDADGNAQTWSSTSTSEVNTTITAKVGTTVTVTAKGRSGGGMGGYSYSTITARYDNNSGTTIATATCTNSTYSSGASATSSAITATSSTFTASKYRGFYKWRIKSITGGSIKSADGTVTYTQYSGSGAVASTNMLDAEETYHFIPSAATGMSVDLEALWAQAYVSTSGAEAHSVGVERNFYVITASANSNITAGSYPCTYTSLYPNGTIDETNAASSVTVYKYGGFTAAADSKIENIILRNNNSTITAAGHNLTIGRGVTPYNENDGCANNLFGLNAAGTTSFSLRIESGKFANLYFLGQGRDFTNDAVLTATMGCDYDRAKVNGGDASFNQKLRVTADIALGMNATTGNTSNKGAEVFNCTVKSGNFDLGTSNYGGAYQFYISAFGSNGTPYTYGKRTLIVEGGIFSDISGGMETDGVVSNDVRMVDIRIKGGTMNSAVYGAAQYSGAIGERRIIITGGTFLGWIAGGANGTKTDGGLLDGASYVYVGGNANVTSDNNTVINRAVGGNVFGAGCGYASTSSSGQVSLGTNVAIADNAIIERGVYGGGSYGYTTQTSNIYILGGTVNCKVGGVNGTTYNANVNGGVYGGACQNQAGRNNVKVYGGTVNGGVYGGGNVSGDVAGPITVDVYGTDPAPSANTYAIHQVFGGGNQADYSGTPVVTVHADNSCDISIGEVYGGGNQATVTGTNVTIEAGNIIGDVYGGGRQANVGNDGTSVTVNGGTIRRVFGGNNVSGTIASGTAGKIAVNVNKTSSCPMKIGQVFGGGNQAASQVGGITIGCTGTLVNPLADGQRYGYDQEGIGAVYGGANNADINGDITLSIVSGIVDSVFGGNNAGGAINGDITVNINKNGSATCASDWYVGYVFGGGNMATYSQKTADHPAVNVQAGLVTNHVFGGGNGSGATVTGNPTVTLSGTAHVGGNVYGGGNAAPVTGNTNVHIQD